MRTVASAFADHGPRGFGLLQRDRNFDHYLDGVRYDLRPSLWVEPLGDWGEGSVQLVEIPTDDEIHDNIVAMWVPKQPATAGTQLARQAAPERRAQVRRRIPGRSARRAAFGVRPRAILWASSGTFSDVFTEAVPDSVPGHWRALFDFTAAGPGDVDMRLYLRSATSTLSETWLYRYRPF